MDKINELLKIIAEKNPFKFLEDLHNQNSGKLFILKYLYDNKKDAKAGELAKELKVSTARVAMLLKKLESSKYIKRYNDPKDARITMVSLTKEGEKYIVKKMETLTDKLKKVVKAMGITKVEDFVKVALTISVILMN